MRILLIISILFLLLGTAFCGEIHDAVKSGDLEKVKTLLYENPEVIAEISDAGSTPLHIAAFDGMNDIALYLIKNGADLEAQNPQGFTPLMFALYRKNSEMAKLLINKGASVNPPSGSMFSPLGFAVETGDEQVIQLMIDNGADVNVIGFTGTPLQRAAFLGNYNIAKILLDNGADMTIKQSRNGWFPLHSSVMNGSVEVAELLLERGAEIDCRDNDKATPLIRAIKSGNTGQREIANLLIKKGADINAVDSEGFSSLYYAVINGYSGIVDILISQGADLSFRDKIHDRNLLHFASIRGYKAIVESLADAGLKVNENDKHENTPLFYAGKYGHKGVAELLKSRGGKAENMEENYDPSEIFNRKLNLGEAYIWYLNYRGIAVKTQNRILIFDYEEHGNKPTEPSISNGYVVPAEYAGQDVIGLYTCYHGGEDELMEVHKISGIADKTFFCQYAGDKFRGVENAYYMDDGDSETYEDVKINTYLMGGYSLAYLIEIDGIKIFYSGFMGEMDEFKAIVDQIEDVDIAVINVDDSEEDFEEILYAVEKWNPEILFPRGNVTGSEKIYLESAKAIAGKSLNTFTICAENGGDRFFYKKR